MTRTFIRTAAIGSISALALAASGTASAASFQAGNTAVNIYGFASLQLIYDLDADLGNSVGHGNIQDSDEISGGNFTMHAVQSRLGVSTTTPTASGDVKTTIEGDFWPGTFRLRHAFGEYNGVLAGQTWSNFLSFVGSSPTLDFTGNIGYGHGGRQPQIRYTMDNLSVAIESPTGGSFSGTVPAGAMGKNSLPDFTVRYEDTSGAFKYAAAAMVGQASWQAGDDDESAMVWGLGLSGSMEVVPGTTIRGTVNGGDGVGRYVYVNTANAAFVDPTNNFEIEPITAFGATVGVTQQAGMGAVSLIYATTVADFDDAEDAGVIDPDTTNESFQSIYLNYIWSPVANVRYGVEAGVHSRKTVSGDSESNTRLQFGASYSF